MARQTNELPMRVRIGFASEPRTRFQLIALKHDDLVPESRFVRERITHPLRCHFVRP
jgi:hypothetical protein